MKNRRLNIADHLSKAEWRQGTSRFGLSPQDATRWQEGIDGLEPVLPRSFNVEGWRVLLLLGVFFVAGLIVLGRLFHLQVINGREFYVLSEQNRVYVKDISAERGVVYDRNGNILARNAPAFSIGVIYSELSDSEEVLIGLLGEIFPDRYDEIVERIEFAKSQPFTQTVIVRNITHDDQIELEAKMSGEGVFVIEDSVRVYPFGELYSNVIGYTGEILASEIENQASDYKLGSYVGRSGIEKQYENELRGEYGRALIEVEATGKVRQERLVESPVSGQDLRLTLDHDVQLKLHDLLVEGINEYAAWGGSAIVTDVNSGEVIAMVSLPTYDNNVFSDVDQAGVVEVLNDPNSLLVNRAISGLYAPGSTVKMAIGANALERGVINSNTQISGSPQVIKVGGWMFPDWTYSWGAAPHGMMDLSRGIANSSDIFFYKVGGGFPPECKTQVSVPCQIDGLGVDGVVEALRMFGFGSRVGVDLPGEMTGLVPDPVWKSQVRGEPWFLGNTYHLSIGQGDLVATPIQVLNVSNIIATNDSTPVIHLMYEEEIVEKYGLDIRKEKPVKIENLVVPRLGMVQAVSEGIVYPLRGAAVPVAAKTGTAEFGQLNSKGEYETHAWVTGFAPVDNPSISFVIMLEAGGKSSNAAEIARKFIDWYYSDL